MFDLDSAKNLFFYIQDSMNKYSSKQNKNISDLFFLIMGLNHLREWIAPRYQKSRNGEWPEASNEAQKFSREIYELPEFIILRNICNGTKHLSRDAPDTSASYGLNIDSWENIDSVANFDKGPPSAFLVEEEDIEVILEKVINYYSTNWFNRNHNEMA